MIDCISMSSVDGTQISIRVVAGSTGVPMFRFNVFGPRHSQILDLTKDEARALKNSLIFMFEFKD